MRSKLTLEALAAWLALAAASGQACASIQTRANGVTGAGGVLTRVANPAASLDEITPYSDGNASANGSIGAHTNVALLTSAAAARKGTRFSPSGAAHLTPGRVGGYGMELKRQAVFNRHDVAPRGMLVAANARGGQIDAIQIARNEDLDGEKFYLVANAKLAPGPTVPVPEPGNWATVLAGLLGVIAIARRRMSL